MILQIGTLLALSILILRWPHLGIAITFASLPLTEILPSINWASSVISVLGGVTLISFLLSRLTKKHALSRRFPMNAVLVIGVMFLLWMLFSNPSAAINPETKGRIWIFTFIQLWLSAWLTVSLFDSTEKIESLMWLFVIAASLSAISAASQGTMDPNISMSVRAEGLVGGANSAARYFVIALTFIFFLFGKQKKRILKLLLISGMIVLFYGVLLTVSRTGLLLLIGSVGLLIMQSVESGKKALSLIAILISAFIVWYFAESITSILRGVLPSIMGGSDTVGVRYGLWHAGFRMWLDNPLAGVGIGNFPENLHVYGWDLLPSHYLSAGAHNMYIAVLSETGIIGFFLFLIMFILTLQILLKAMRSTETDISELAKNWFIVTILILLAGITKHDHYDKSTWIVVGIGGAFVFLNQRSEMLAFQSAKKNSNKVAQRQEELEAKPSLICH